MKLKNLCPICVAISSLWWVLSVGVVLGFLNTSLFTTPIALLMGGTVVGIAYVGEKRVFWAVRNPQKWKITVITVGIISAYLFVINLNKLVILVELLVLIIIAYLLFVREPSKTANDSKRFNNIEKKMKQCC